MNYTENNKLTAEFMGLTVEDNEWVVINEGQGVHREYRTQARYHQSWDWLMPVVEKIYKMDEYISYCVKTGEPVGLSTRIDKVYNATIAFIKWYNENK